MQLSFCKILVQALRLCSAYFKSCMLLTHTPTHPRPLLQVIGGILFRLEILKSSADSILLRILLYPRMLLDVQVQCSLK